MQEIEPGKVEHIAEYFLVPSRIDAEVPTLRTACYAHRMA